MCAHSLKSKGPRSDYNYSKIVREFTQSLQDILKHTTGWSHILTKSLYIYIHPVISHRIYRYITLVARESLNQNSTVRFDILTVRMTMLFWILTPCRPVRRCQSFGETYSKTLVPTGLQGVETQNIA
jgi:hypothetical protein